MPTLIKKEILFAAIAIGVVAPDANAQKECSLFTANFIGLEAALDICARTPKFNAWVAEERARLAVEEKMERANESKLRSNNSNEELRDTAQRVSPLDSNALAATETDTTPVSPFENYLDGFCKTFLKTEINLLEPYLRDMEKSPYFVDRYFQAVGCQAEGFGHVIKSPLMHLMADDPDGKEKFPSFLYNYFQRRDPASWLKAVNATNSKGQTTLDYFEHQLQKEAYPINYSKIAAQNIVSFLCSRGAKYSYYKNKTCSK